MYKYIFIYPFTYVFTFHLLSNYVINSVVIEQLKIKFVN